MRPFAYLRPTTLDQTIAALVDPGSKPYLLAGGTDLIVRLRRGHLRPTVVIDTKHVADLHDEIVAIDDGLRFGARVTMTSIIRDSRVRQHFQALVEAAAVVGSVQIRNRATLAGNICNASPAADTVPALLVYGAVANVVGPAGWRTVPLSEFFTGPGRTVLTRGEIVESIDLPDPEVPRWRCVRPGDASPWRRSGHDQPVRAYRLGRERSLRVRRRRPDAVCRHR